MLEQLPLSKYEQDAADIVRKRQEREILQEYALIEKAIKMPDKCLENARAHFEQNIMELPICVANNKEVKRDHIIIDYDDKTQWKLTRPIDGTQAPPEYYSYFLWLIDKFRDMLEHGYVKDGVPLMVIDPMQIYRDVEIPKILMARQGELFEQEHKVCQPGGSYYKKLHRIFTTFARLEISTHTSWHDKRGNKERLIKIEKFGQHLCYYNKWAIEKNGIIVSEGAEIAPGPLVWESIKQGYIATLPFSVVNKIPGSPFQRYLIQRLYVYLTKHLYRLDEYPVGLRKLLAKIPMSLKTTPADAQRKLFDAHEYLVAQGLLAEQPRWNGRGANKMLLYSKGPALKKEAA